MNRSSSVLAFEEKIENPADVYKRSLALNFSVSEYHPLILSYILSFDEIVHNMQIFFKLSKLSGHEDIALEELSPHELFLFCREHGILRWTLSEWMLYQGLRCKIHPDMDEKLIHKIATVAPRFVDEINFMVAGLERELRKYRTLN